MPLIRTHRHTDADLAAWERYERYDRVLAGTPALDRLTERSVRVLTEFASRGPCLLGISWGRDSLTVAHLIATAGLRIPMVRMIRDLPYIGESPDIALTRDRFLEQFPNVEYSEFHTTSHDGLGAMNRATGVPYVSGVRADEAAIRRKAMRLHGEASKGSCRPIGWWKSQDVWAYLHRHGVDIPPQYGYSFGGTIPRDELRVHELGSQSGLERSQEWERTYYPDVMSQLAERTWA